MEIEKGIYLGTCLLQQALQSICMKSEWVYAVFWRILPRNFPPPKWDTVNGVCDKSGENSRNWMLVWEDGFCDFNSGLQPGLFFKMSHEIYNYGEGIMGKLAANQGYQWIYKDQLIQSEMESLKRSLHSHPRTWESQFNSGIQTIALVAVREGLLQLGSTQKGMEDLKYVIFLQRKFNYLLSIPSVLTPYPSSQGPVSHSTLLSKDSNASKDYSHLQYNNLRQGLNQDFTWSTQDNGDTKLSKHPNASKNYSHLQYNSLRQGLNQDYNFEACSGLHSLGFIEPATVAPSMSSLQALLSKLPSVTPSSWGVPSNMPAEDNMDVD
ncbi:hypothetical protein SUGI_0241120 [Cryptomeria japonica]|uniref:protein RICE SALT SENSITIVE 3 n=1 Tax=Cryptomeria japonica TaxID=3369 RepID=UPI002408A96B|nr:protein RICE SALT SENSITIVE 3 [Cryptomeria japonica]GLJ14825.1 hypothetical protein SUGI_0241120 [Cryptomeria japonica]